MVRNDHHREERNQRGEQQAVNKNDEAGALQVFQLRAFDLPVHLGQRFFAAHRQHRVPEAHQQHDHRDAGCLGPEQPAQRFTREIDVVRSRNRRQVEADLEDRVAAPDDQDHHHDGGDLHDLQRLVARLVNALDVLPPEIHNGKNRECRCEVVVVEMDGMMGIAEQVFDEAGEVQARRDGADRSGQDVVEQQRGNREARQRGTKRLFDDAIHAAAHEHRARFHVDSANGVAKHHHREDEPRCALADYLFGVATSVIGGGGKVGKNDCRHPPERDKAQHDGGGNEYGNGVALQVFGCRGHLRFRLWVLGTKYPAGSSK